MELVSFTPCHGCRFAEDPLKNFSTSCVDIFCFNRKGLGSLFFDWCHRNNQSIPLISLVPRPPPFFVLMVCVQYTCNTRKQKGAKTALLLPCIILNANRRTKNGWGLGARLTFDDDGGLLLLSSSLTITSYWCASLLSLHLIACCSSYTSTWRYLFSNWWQPSFIDCKIWNRFWSFHFCSCSETFLSA